MQIAVATHFRQNPFDFLFACFGDDVSEVVIRFHTRQKREDTVKFGNGI